MGSFSGHSSIAGKSIPREFLNEIFLRNHSAFMISLKVYMKYLNSYFLIVK